MNCWDKSKRNILQWFKHDKPSISKTGIYFEALVVAVYSTFHEIAQGSCFVIFHHGLSSVDFTHTFYFTGIHAGNHMTYKQPRKYGLIGHSTEIHIELL